MPLNLNLQVHFISKLELSLLTQVFEMEVPKLWRNHWRKPSVRSLKSTVQQVSVSIISAM